MKLTTLKRLTSITILGLVLLAFVLGMSVGYNLNKNPIRELPAGDITLRLHRHVYLTELSTLIRYFDNYYHSTEELLSTVELNDSTSPEHIIYSTEKEILNEYFNKLEYNSNHKH